MAKDKAAATPLPPQSAAAPRPSSVPPACGGEIKGGLSAGDKAAGASLGGENFDSADGKAPRQSGAEAAANAVVVFIRDLRLRAFVGMEPAEANIRQQIAVDVEVIAAAPPQTVINPKTNAAARPPSVPPTSGGEVKVSSPFAGRPGASVPPACGGEVKGGLSAMHPAAAGENFDSIDGKAPSQTAAAAAAAPPSKSQSDSAPPQTGKPAVDYADLIRRLRELAQSGRFILLEDLAEAIAAAIFAGFPAAIAVKIRCAKPRLFADVAAAGVEIKRTRPPA